MTKVVPREECETVECLSCSWQGKRNDTRAGHCPDCGDECSTLNEIYGETMTTKQTEKPTFEQQLDISRPHTLLTQDTKHTGTLLYRYDDTQQLVSVPNIWYNQTYQERVAFVRWDAARLAEQAEQYKKNPPTGYTKDAIADVYRRYQERIARIRAEADRMEQAGKDSAPVAAARMPLDFGDNVFS